MPHAIVVLEVAAGRRYHAHLNILLVVLRRRQRQLVLEARWGLRLALGQPQAFEEMVGLGVETVARSRLPPNSPVLWPRAGALARPTIIRKLCETTDTRDDACVCE